MEGREHVNKIFSHFYKSKFEGVRESKQRGRKSPIQKVAEKTEAELELKFTNETRKKYTDEAHKRSVTGLILKDKLESYNIPNLSKLLKPQLISRYIEVMTETDVVKRRQLNVQSRGEEARRKRLKLLSSFHLLMKSFRRVEYNLIKFNKISEFSTSLK